MAVFGTPGLMSTNSSKYQSRLATSSLATNFHSSMAGRNIQTAAFSNGSHVKAKWLWDAKQKRGRNERRGGTKT
jgi:hypothetical protein